MGKHRLRALSNLSANFSEIFLGSLVIPILLERITPLKVTIIFFGIICCISFGFLSLTFADKGKL